MMMMMMMMMMMSLLQRQRMMKNGRRRHRERRHWAHMHRRTSLWLMCWCCRQVPPMCRLGSECPA
jgi:hypothetical protein